MIIKCPTCESNFDKDNGLKCDLCTKIFNPLCLGLENGNYFLATLVKDKIKGMRFYCNNCEVIIDKKTKDISEKEHTEKPHDHEPTQTKNSEETTESDHNIEEVETETTPYQDLLNYIEECDKKEKIPKEKPQTRVDIHSAVSNNAGKYGKRQIQATISTPESKGKTDQNKKKTYSNNEENVCFKFLNGTCKYKAGQCIYEHPRICAYYRKTGKCYYKNECKYYHVKICRNIEENGQCKWKEKCHYFHPTVCKFYEEDQCYNKNKCLFFHPKVTCIRKPKPSIEASYTPSSSSSSFLNLEVLTDLMRFLHQMGPMTERGKNMQTKYR